MNRRSATMSMALMTAAISAATLGMNVLDVQMPSTSGRGGGTGGINMGPHNYKACGKRQAMNKIARRSRKINGAKR